MEPNKQKVSETTRLRIENRVGADLVRQILVRVADAVGVSTEWEGGPAYNGLLWARIGKELDGTEWAWPEAQALCVEPDTYEPWDMCCNPLPCPIHNKEKTDG